MERELNSQQLLELVSDKSSKKSRGVWTEIAEVLPARTVQSCHNLCRRKFSPFNYKGRWSEEDAKMLLLYIEKFGRKWKKIGELLNRTGLNVRDKYRSLGEANHSTRLKGK